jgi:hypothetical protein
MKETLRRVELAGLYGLRVTVVCYAADGEEPSRVRKFLGEVKGHL